MFDEKVIQKIKDQLIKKEETIAVAESVTAGFLQAALASAENASSFFQGGLTAYNLGQKCRHLNVNPIHAQSCNCVSEKMAVDMAQNIMHSFTSNWGIGITGYATIVPESHNELFAYYAIVYNGGVLSAKEIKVDKNKTPGQEVQLYYVDAVLAELATLIEAQ